MIDVAMFYIAKEQHNILTASEILSLPSPLSSPLLIEFAMIGSTMALMGLYVRRLFCDAGATHAAEDAAPPSDSAVDDEVVPLRGSKHDTGRLGGVDGGNDGEVAGVVSAVAVPSCPSRFSPFFSATASRL